MGRALRLRALGCSPTRGRLKASLSIVLDNAFNHPQFFVDDLGLGFVDLADFLVNRIDDNGTTAVLRAGTVGSAEGFAAGRVVCPGRATSGPTSASTIRTRTTRVPPTAKVRLRGWLYTPTGTPPANGFPILVFNHGSEEEPSSKCLVIFADVPDSLIQPCPRLDSDGNTLSCGDVAHSKFVGDKDQVEKWGATVVDFLDRLGAK